MEKYELTEEFISFNNIKLYRIKALKNFSDVKAGDLGGYIQSEKNLSHDDDCWISGKAEVSGNVIVSGNAIVSDNARVLGNAEVFGNAIVYGNAIVSGNAMVFGKVRLHGNAIVSDNARVLDNASIFGSAGVSDKAIVSGNARVSGTAIVSGRARLHGNAIATKDVMVSNFIYNLTLTDNHIRFGCEQKTVDEWITWLDSDDVIQTPRHTDKFNMIESALRLAIQYHEYRK